MAGLFTPVVRYRGGSGWFGKLRRRARARTRPFRHCDGGCRVSALVRASGRPERPCFVPSLRAAAPRTRPRAAADPTRPVLSRAHPCPRTAQCLCPSSVTTLSGPAILARCKGPATVNSCVSGSVAFIIRYPHGESVFRKLLSIALTMLFGKMNELRSSPGE